MAEIVPSTPPVPRPKPAYTKEQAEELALRSPFRMVGFKSYFGCELCDLGLSLIVAAGFVGWALALEGRKRHGVR